MMMLVDYDHHTFMESIQCADACSRILERNPYDEAIWSLKTRFTIILMIMMTRNPNNKAILESQYQFLTFNPNHLHDYNMIKPRALTEQVLVDDVEADEEGSLGLMSA